MEDNMFFEKHGNTLLEGFKNKYPKQSETINGRIFPYRYYKNEYTNKTVVLLTGGIGLSDLLLFHFEKFAKSYSVLSFDYHIAYPSIQELVEAITGLLKKLNIKSFLIGQSLGGFIAQILAKQHPEVVEGLILSNTGTLFVELNEEGRRCFNNMIKRINISLLIIRLMPFCLIKKNIKKAVLKKVTHLLSENEKELMSQICDEMEITLTKEYEIHMTLLLKDLQNHWNMKRSDFLRFQDRVLLILSDDDLTFDQNIKNALIDIMPNPKVITDIRGGHLALLLKIDKYARVITNFIDSI
jgi:pimeloyl-ACP methyl ester carboxylesterase